MKRLALASLLMLLMATPVSAQEAPASVRFVEYHSPVAAGIFSFFMPGAGQAYNGEWEKGGIFLGAGIVFYTMTVATQKQFNTDCDDLNGGSGECSSVVPVMFALAYLGNWVSAVVDAARTAKRLNAEALAQPSIAFTPTVGKDGRVGVSFSIRR